LTLSIEEIEKLVEKLDKESRAIKTDLLRMTWYMRGGVSYDDVMQMSAVERELINAVIKENIEFVKKSKMPIL